MISDPKKTRELGLRDDKLILEELFKKPFLAILKWR